MGREVLALVELGSVRSGRGRLLALQSSACASALQQRRGSDRLVDAVVAWGGPEVIAEQVRAHLDAGADHVCVQVLDPDPNGLPMASWRALAPALLER